MMSTLQFYTVLCGLWLALAWAPYILDRVFVRGLIGAMGNYDPHDTPQSDWAQRAMRAHTVGVEAFVAFAPLAILAMMLRPEDPLPGTLAMTFFFALIAHYVIYCLGIIIVRTLIFVVMVLSSASIALRLLEII